MTPRLRKQVLTLCGLIGMPVASHAIDSASIEYLSNPEAKQVRAGLQWDWQRRWLESDEQAATTWIKQSSLSQQQKDRLLKNRQ